jgi:hypothetical protein
MLDKIASQTHAITLSGCLGIGYRDDQPVGLQQGPAHSAASQQEPACTRALSRVPRPGRATTMSDSGVGKVLRKFQSLSSQTSPIPKTSRLTPPGRGTGAHTTQSGGAQPPRCQALKTPGIFHSGPETPHSISSCPRLHEDEATLYTAELGNHCEARTPSA